jgi:hypothetical protein
MKGFGLPGAALTSVFAFFLAAPALAGGFAGSAHFARAPGVQRIPHTLSPSHRDERAGRSELELGAPVYGTSDSESPEAPPPIPAPVVAPFFYLLPEYARPLEVAESRGPRIIYIGREEAPSTPAVGPKIIYGDEQAPTHGGVTVIYGDP